MVLGRFFQKRQQQEETATNGLGGVAALDDAMVDPRLQLQQTAAEPPDAKAVFQKKKAPPIQQQSSSSDDDFDSDTDDQSFFANAEDDETVDSNTTGAIKEMLKNNFLKDFMDNQALTMSPPSEHDGDEEEDPSSSFDGVDSERDDRNNNNNIGAAPSNNTSTTTRAWGWFGKPPKIDVQDDRNDGVVQASVADQNVSVESQQQQQEASSPSEKESSSSSNLGSAKHAIVEEAAVESSDQDTSNNKSSPVSPPRQLTWGWRANQQQAAEQQQAVPVELSDSDADSDDSDHSDVEQTREFDDQGKSSQDMGKDHSALNTVSEPEVERSSGPLQPSRGDGLSAPSSARRLAWGWRAKQAAEHNATIEVPKSDREEAVGVSDSEDDSEVSENERHVEANIQGNTSFCDEQQGGLVRSSLVPEVEECSPLRPGGGNEPNAPRSTWGLGWGGRAKQAAEQAAAAKESKSDQEPEVALSISDADSETCDEGESERQVEYSNDAVNADQNDYVRSGIEQRRPLQQAEGDGKDAEGNPRRIGLGLRAKQIADLDAAAKAEQESVDALSDSEAASEASDELVTPRNVLPLDVDESMSDESTSESLDYHPEAESCPNEHSETGRNENESIRSGNVDAPHSVVPTTKVGANASSQGYDESQASESEHSDISLRSEPGKSSLDARKDECLTPSLRDDTEGSIADSESTRESEGDAPAVANATQVEQGSGLVGASSSAIDDDISSPTDPAAPFTSEAKLQDYREDQTTAPAQSETGRTVDSGWFGKSLSSRSVDSSEQAEPQKTGEVSVVCSGDRVHTCPSDIEDKILDKGEKPQSEAPTDGGWSGKCLSSLSNSEKMEPSGIESKPAEADVDFQSLHSNTRDHSLANAIDTEDSSSVDNNFSSPTDAVAPVASDAQMKVSQEAERSENHLRKDKDLAVVNDSHNDKSPHTNARKQVGSLPHTHANSFPETRDLAYANGNIEKQPSPSHWESSSATNNQRDDQTNENKKQRGWGWFARKNNAEASDGKQTTELKGSLSTSLHTDDRTARKQTTEPKGSVSTSMHGDDRTGRSEHLESSPTTTEELQIGDEQLSTQQKAREADSESCCDEDDSKLPEREHFPLVSGKMDDDFPETPSRLLSGVLPAPLAPKEAGNDTTESAPTASREGAFTKSETPQVASKRNQRNLALAPALVQQQLADQADSDTGSTVQVTEKLDGVDKAVLGHKHENLAIAEALCELQHGDQSAENRNAPLTNAEKPQPKVPLRNYANLAMAHALVEQQYETQSSDDQEPVHSAEKPMVPRRNYANLAMARALVEEQCTTQSSDDQKPASFNDDPPKSPSTNLPRTRAIMQALNSEQSEDPLSRAYEDTGPENSAVKSVEAVVETADGAGPGNAAADESGSEELSESEEESESENEDGNTNKPYKLVVKEAPLLRLENVTAATRSQLPVKSAQKKTRAWGWFGAKTKGGSENKGTQEENKGTQEEGSASHHEVDPGKLDEVKNKAPLIRACTTEKGKAGELEIGDGATSTAAVNVGTDSDSNAIIHTAMGESENENGCFSGSAKDIMETSSHLLMIGQPQSRESERSSELASATENGTAPDPDSMTISPHTSPSQNHEPPLSPERISALLYSKGKLSPSKRKKKKKKGGISTLLEKDARKVNRHGDEVSVGTMNYNGGKSGRVVVMTGTNALFDDHELGPKSRPWESSISKGPKRYSDVQKKSPLDAIGCLAEDDDEDLKKIESLGFAEELFKEKSADSKSQLPVLAETDEFEDEDDDDDDDNDDGVGEDGTSELHEVSYLEQTLAADDAPEVDFDDMWDTVSCDMSTALEFERHKRKKTHEKEKKRQKREQEKEEKANAARRLRLFERRKEKEGQRSTSKTGKQSKLSDEFIDAIHKVFDEGSVNSLGSYSDHDESDADIPDDMSGDGSCHSLYLRGEEGGDSESSDSRLNQKRAAREGDEVVKSSDDDLDVGTDSVEGSKSKCSRNQKSSRRGDNALKASTRSSMHSKYSITSSRNKLSKRDDIDSSEIFMAEVERLKKPKVLTIQTLRQEMVDRRGTSVNLLKKEYVNFRKKRNDRRKSQEKDNLHQLDFRGLSALPASFGNETTDIFGGQADEQVEEKPRSDGLAAKLSRWATAEGVTELDDLATVHESPAHPVNFMGIAAALAKNAAAHIPEMPNAHDLNGFARDTGKGINTIGTNVYGAGQTLSGNLTQVGGRAGRTIGSGLGQGAQVVGSGLNQGIHTLGSGIGRGLHSVGHEQSSIAQSLPTIGSSTIVEIPKPSDEMNMFTANFSDMPLTSIQESDDDDDFGLLAGHSKDHDTDDDDNFSFHSSNSKRSYNGGSGGGGGGGGGGSRFKIKAPNLGKQMKKLVPKMPSMPKRDGSRGKSSNGFMMNDDGYGVGLLG
jgi:hypothetical protein